MIRRTVTAHLGDSSPPKFSIVIGVSDLGETENTGVGGVVASAPEIMLPPVRQYPSIAAVVEYLLEEQNRFCGKETKLFDHKALAALSAYFWEGNLEQIRLALRYALTITAGDTIMPGDLPAYLYQGERESMAGEYSDEAKRKSLSVALQFNN